MTHQTTSQNRLDYRPFDYSVEGVRLDVLLEESATKVVMTATFVYQGVGEPSKLSLSMGQMTLSDVKISGVSLAPGQFILSENTLDILSDQTSIDLEISAINDPSENTALEGLYKSGHNYYTQCEAEGFRRIVPFPDRPDVLTTYTVSITADKAEYPVLLSNGNKVSETDNGDGTHTVVWHDPFPKPSYLFALVAGKFDHIHDAFVTRSGQTVDLHFWTDPGEGDKCAHAVQSLKDAMKWDEDVYGLEYDLDVYNVVAVGDFNMGAMENKSLNIFNTSCVLARPENATDGDFAAVQAVVAHEYFHNWTGNRITCQDWFQLSLKEGLTVFRDQEFSADMGSRAVKRIEDVRMLRAMQFPEDAGPMAHPIRPESYIEINNFYTLTVYEKGAEVIRMIHTLLGDEGYQKGMKVYVERHDGKAATCEDFVKAMEDGSGVDLSQFRLWYSQAGTPVVKAETVYDADAQTLTLSLKQTIPATPGQSDKQAMHIPFAVGLLDADGKSLDVYVQGREGHGETVVLDFTQAEQQFVLTHVPSRPVVSMLRGFSAPVRLESDVSDIDQLFLMGHDPDAFVRWDMTQDMARKQILSQIDGEEGVSPEFIGALRNSLVNPDLDDAFKALLLTLPSESVLGEAMKVVNPDGVHLARKAVRHSIALALHDEFQATYQKTLPQRGYEFSAEEVGRRALNSLALSYVMAANEALGTEWAEKQYTAADNMTDQYAALSVVVNSNSPIREELLEAFYTQWKGDALVVNKWLSVQATHSDMRAYDRVKDLMAHESFVWTNPNKIRALIGAFCRANPFVFHAADGRGYKLLADAVIKLDAMNPQIAARLVVPLTAWRRFDADRQARMMSELQRIAGTKGLSPNTFEHVSKSLES